MATSLATARGNVSTALASAVTSANHYKRRQTNPQFPCIVVGWPDELDVRPAFGDARDFTLSVWIGVEVGDDDSADDLLSSLLESAVTALQATSGWDVQPATDFGESLTEDGRVIVWCRLPVLVLA